jgi:hypothetical protein
MREKEARKEVKIRRGRKRGGKRNTPPHPLRELQVHAGILASDFNTIEDFYRAMPIEHKLTDACLVLGGLEDSDEGFTWGF